MTPGAVADCRRSASGSVLIVREIADLVPLERCPFLSTQILGFSRKCRTVAITASKCCTVVIVASKCRTVAITASRCRTVVITASKCRTVVITASKCRTVAITASKCRTVVITASKCRTFVITASKCRTFVVTACWRAGQRGHAGLTRCCNPPSRWQQPSSLSGTNSMLRGSFFIFLEPANFAGCLWCAFLSSCGLCWLCVSSFLPTDTADLVRSLEYLVFSGCE